MGYGVDRTFSAQQWRVVVYSACGVLIAGIGLGVLIGRLTAPVPEVPPASASILPDVPPPTSPTSVTPSTAGDDDTDAPAPAPVAAAPPPPAPVVKAPPAPAVQKPPPTERVATPKPERTASPKPVEAKVKPVPAKPAASEPEPPADGARWVVQLGAFQSSDHANLLVNTLAAHGQAAHVTFAQNAAGQGWFYVQTSPYRSAAAAKSAAQGLAAREHLPTYVLKLPDAG